MITHQPYPSDVSDAEWQFVVPYLCLLPEEAGQRVHNLRDVFDAARWLVRSGSPWRYLPKDFPPWEMVYQQTRRWLAAGCFEAIVHDLRAVLRFADGRDPEPTAAIFDSRTVRSTPESGGRAGAAGGIVNVTTKSGTNPFHGVVWEFNRLSAYTSNTVLNAQQGLPKGKYTRNQFGFAVGGPINKDKLFFFGSTEWTRVRSTGISIAAVPTPQFLSLTAPNTQAFFSQYGGGKSFNFHKDLHGRPGLPWGIPAGVPASTPAFGTVAYQAPINTGGSVPQNT